MNSLIPWTVRLPVPLVQRDALQQWQSLSPFERELVAAAALVVSEVEEYVPLADLSNQVAESDFAAFDSAVASLARQNPPLLRVVSDHFTITHRGLEVALKHRQMELEPADFHPTPEPQALRHKKSHNQAMREYAKKVGGTFEASSGKRCNFCTHEEARFVKKGGKRLCQVCFGDKELRPW